MKNARLKVLAAVMLMIGAAPWATAQTAGVTGTVADGTGASVAGAEVRIINVDTGLARSTTSNEQGQYSVPLLPPGPYRAVVVKEGFRQVSRTSIQLDVADTARLDFVLEVGSVADSVEVSADAPLLDTEGATIGKVVESRRISDLPLNGRNVLALTMITPGVKSNAGPTNSGFADRGLSLSEISVNGGPNALNQIILDGISSIQPVFADPTINPPVDAIQEFRVQSGTMSSEYGFTAGGVINLVTKAGSNQTHGTLYHFLRNSALDGRNTFSVTKPPFRFNQFGGALGGHVIKDKLFYFGNWEEWRYKRSVPLIASFPTLQQRTGDFSDLRDTAGRAIPIYDPSTTVANPSGSGFVRTPFPGNRIPASQLDPVSLAIQKYYPVPNRTPSDPFSNANNTEKNATETRSQRGVTARVDYRVSAKNNLYGRFSFFDYRTDGGTSGANIYPDDFMAKRYDVRPHYNYLLADTHTFTSTLVNDFRIGLARIDSWGQPGSFNGNYPEKVGLPAIVPQTHFPQVLNGLPQTTSGGRGVRGTVYWTFSEIMTKIHGNHSFRFGGDVRIAQGNNYQPRNPSGQWTFTSGLTGNPQSQGGTGSIYASFLTGAVSSAFADTHVGYSMQGYSTSFFFQDDWKVSRNLTLNLGIRHDFQPQPVERWNGMSNFDPFAKDPATGLLGITTFAGRDGQPRSFRQNDYNDFGPRIGFAYRLPGARTTVIRGGAAVFYPFIFHVGHFGGTAGFERTTTTYLPPGGNANLPAFQFRIGFPSAPIPPLGANLGAGGLLGSDVSWQESTGTTPRSQQWTLSLQHQLPGNWLVDVGYAGNRGVHFPAGGYDYNQLDPQNLSLGLALQQQVPNPYAGKVPGALGSATITRQQSLRPYPYYNSIGVRSPLLGSYTSQLLLISVERKMAKGVAFLFSYTGGKLMSDSITTPLNFGGAENVSFTGYQNGLYNRQVERSVDPSDVSSRGVISAIFELPFGAGRHFSSSNRVVNKLIGGWQANSIGTMQSGLPMVIRGANNFLADRPNSTGKSAKLDNPTAARWFDTSQFVNPPAYTFGNVGRALPDVRGPGTINWDLSLIKNTSLTERINLQFRAESFNFMNHVNLNGTGQQTFVAGANGTNSSGTFGVITSARDARTIQFGLKLVF